MPKNKKKAKPVTKLKKEPVKLSETVKDFITASIVVLCVSFLLFLIGYNIKDSIVQGVYFVAVTVLIAILCGVFGKKKLHMGLEMTGVGIASICLFITVVNVYNVADEKFGWSLKQASNEAYSKIVLNCDKIYSTDTTSLYVNWDTMKLFSITNTGDSNYFYETNISDADLSEYGTLYDTGLFVDSTSDKISSLAIHPATISTLADYEHLIEFKHDEKVYVAPTFIMGNIKWSDSDAKPVAEVQFSGKSDQNYKIYNLGETFFIQNSFMAFITPYKTVEYDSNAKFSVRYEKMMQEFDESYKLPDNLEFGLSKTMEVDDDDIVRISFYYEIYSDDNEGGLLMEIIHKDNTSDVCYIREMYAENLVSVQVKED